MPAPTKTLNPVIQRIKADNLLGGAQMPPANPFAYGMVQPGPDIGTQNAMNNAGVYAPGSFGAQNAAANNTGVAGSPAQFNAAVGMSGAPAPTNPFSVGIPAQGSPLPPAQAPVLPQNPFAVGVPAGMVPVQPVHAYAPTDLRQRAIAAGGGGVYGTGDVGASFDGMNSQGGMKFSLGQITPVGGPQAVPFTPPNPAGPENLQAPSFRPSTAETPTSPNAGLLAAFPAESPMAKYIKAQEANRLPVDMDHLELLTKMDNNQQKNTNTATGLTMKLTAAEQKQKDLEQGHAVTLAQINEQNKAVLDNIDKAISLAPGAGPIAGRLVGTVMAPDNVKQLHALLDSISGNEMMDYIQRLKNANPQGTIGFRVLDTEAKAMANVFAAIKNDKVPLEQQSPAFVKEQLNNLRGHLVRMNAIANGQDPDSVAPLPSATSATAQTTGDLAALAQAELARRKGAKK